MDTVMQAPDWAGLIASHAGGPLLRVDCPLAQVADDLRGTLAYLATPYTREVVDATGCWTVLRSVEVELRTALWARALARRRVTVAAPILTACQIISVGLQSEIDPLDAAFWTAWCAPLLAASAAVIVPPMDGWRDSAGVWHEVVWALNHAKPVYLIAPLSGTLQ